MLKKKKNPSKLAIILDEVQGLNITIFPISKIGGA